MPPEATTCSAETGWIVHPDASSRWELDVFWTSTRDARILYNDPPGAVGADAYISKSEDLTTYGVELTHDRRVNDNLRWFANYTYLRENVTNHNEPFIPVLFIRPLLSHQRMSPQQAYVPRVAGPEALSAPGTQTTMWR